MIEPQSPFCVVFVTTTEPDQFIANRRRLLVTALARIRNTGMKFNAQERKS